MIKKTIARAASTLVIAGALTAAAAASANAATPPAPINHAAAKTQSVSQVAPQPQYSRRFTLKNGITGDQMWLLAITGDEEGTPPLRSIMHDGESQDFEVQYIAAGTGTVDATYAVSNQANGDFYGSVTIRMTYNCWGQTNTSILSHEGLNGATILNADSTNPEITWSY
jgi:hypothetical protein